MNGKNMNRRIVFKSAFAGGLATPAVALAGPTQSHAADLSLADQPEVKNYYTMLLESGQSYLPTEQEAAEMGFLDEYYKSMKLFSKQTIAIQNETRLRELKNLEMLKLENGGKFLRRKKPLPSPQYMTNKYIVRTRWNQSFYFDHVGIKSTNIHPAISVIPNYSFGRVRYYPPMGAVTFWTVTRSGTTQGFKLDPYHDSLYGTFYARVVAVERYNLGM